MAETIFLTGSSGLVGNRCLLKALKDGYKVIASVRSEAKANAVRKSVGESQNLSFQIIPDLTPEGVFDDVLKSVEYVVNVASPLWTVSDFSDMNKAFVQPAVRSTINILEAAKKSRSVKKVVLCSSLAALVTRPRCFGDDIDGVTYTASSRVPNSYYPRPGRSEEYFEGKTKALNFTDEFVKQNLHFDVINIFPSTVIGRCEMATTRAELLSTSNKRGLAIAIGEKLDPVPTTCIHVDDLANMHIDILRMKTAKYHNFAAGMQMTYEEQPDITRKHFCEAIENGVFPMKGSIPDRPFILDCSATEEFYGWKFRSFEDQVVDVAKQYLELA